MSRENLGPLATLPNGDRNPLTHVVRAGDFIFISGLMPKNAQGQLIDGPIEAQTKAVMARLVDMLAEAGATLEDVVKVNVWLTDAEDFPAFNATYSGFFNGVYPARSAVRSDLLLPTARVELEAIAYQPR